MLTPLALVSSFSFGDGILSPEEWAGELCRLGYRSLAITDSLNVCGLVRTIEVCRNAGLNFLWGMHLPLAPRGDVWVYPGDETGYRSLCRLITSLHGGAEPIVADDLEAKARQPFQEKTRRRHQQILCGHEQLGQLRGGLRVVASDDALGALKNLEPGIRRFWGLQNRVAGPHLESFSRLAASLQARGMAFPRFRATSPGDRLFLRLVQALHANTLLDRVPVVSDPLLPVPADLETAWAGLPEEMLEENRRFAAEACWHPPLGSFFMPRVAPSQTEACARLRALAVEGLRRRYVKANPEVQSRFEREMQVIAERGFADYFLAVHEIKQEAANRGTRVLGRGSAANSLVSYALGLTHVDPLRYGLFFERFLNPERTSPPDIDLDFSWKLRDQVYDFLRDRWGSGRVAVISTHVTLGGRGALRESGKILGFPSEEIDRFARVIRSVKDFLSAPNKRPETASLPPATPAFRRWLRLAARLEDLPVHLSLHAGGVVIAPESLDCFTPCQPCSKGLPLTQMEMRAIEAVGLVKIDLLAQRSLGVFADVEAELQPAGGVPPELDDVERLAEDPSVKQALREGRTMGVFYVESPGMRALLKKLDCQGFADLTAASSVIRPGVAESGMMQAYIQRHRHPASIPPLHPIMARLLADTHGVMVYQEDVIRVAHEMGGLSLAEGDLLRRAMSGKARSSEAMTKMRTRFVTGAVERGVPPDLAEDVWRQMESFSGYAFCKAHSASYAVLSLQLLWMKCYHPARFMARVIDNRGGFYGTWAYVSEARRLGCEVLAPSLMKCDWDCVVEENRIFLGFSFIKRLRKATFDRLRHERKQKPFAGPTDFLRRVEPAENEFEAMIDSGALESLGTPAVLHWAQKLWRGSRYSLFDSEPEIPILAHRPLNAWERAQGELRALELMLSAHPFDGVCIPDGLIAAVDLHRYVGQQVRVGGVLIAAKPVTTKTGERMRFLTLEDRSGLIEVTVFPRCYKQEAVKLIGNSLFIVEGRVDGDQGVPTVIARRLLLPIPRSPVPWSGRPG